MQTITAFLLSVLLAAAPAAAWAGKSPKASGPDEPMDIRASLLVEVDANGAVTSARLRDKDAERLPASIADPLLADAREWRFEPATRNGEPVASSTHVRVTLRAEPVDEVGEAWALRIARATNGPQIARSVPPRYPMDAIRARAAARVTVEVDIAADGTVTDSRLVDVEVAARHRRHADAFAAATLAGTQAWHYVPEQVAGQPVASTVREVTTYCVNNVKCYETHEPDSPVDGESIAEAPVTRPLTALVGRTL